MLVRFDAVLNGDKTINEFRFQNERIQTETLQHTIINRGDLPHDGNTFEFEGFRFPVTLCGTL